MPLKTLAARCVAAAMLMLAAAALAADPPKPAADRSAAPTAEKAAAPAEKAPKPAPPITKGAMPDPMDQLREKLAERLGASKPPDSKNPNLMRVVTKSEAPKPNAAVLAARHRAEKAAEASAGDAAAPATASGAGPKGHEPHWSYAGAGAPERWGELKPEFSACARGQRQSPIDIRGGIRVDLEPIAFDYRPTGFSVVDNGHTVQVDVGPGNAIEVMGRRYDLQQFHFHRPSEERIQGRQFDMVAHLVHKDPEGRLAVVAVLLDRGGAQPLIQTIWNHIPLEKGMSVPARGALDLNALLPQDRRYFTYMGSLTTPPCSEGVLWMVMAQPVTISPEQIAVFGHLYPMNARPVQQAAGRLIKQSN